MSKGRDDFSIGLDRDFDWRRLELTNNKTVKRNFYNRSKLKAVFDFAEHQEEATHGLEYILTKTGDNNDAVLNKSELSNIARIEINIVPWYIPHYTPSSSQQGILSKQTLNRTSTELRYIEVLIL